MRTWLNRLHCRVALVLPLAATLGCAFTRFASADDVAPGDFGRLEAAANATAARLVTNALAWRTEIEIEGTDAVAVVDVVHAPDRRRMVISYALGDQTEFLVEIIERDDRWYVRDRGQLAMCRPYEAVMTAAEAYHFLARSELQLAGAAEQLARSARLVSDKDGVVEFRSDLPPEKKRQMQTALDAVERLLPAADPDQQRRLAARRDMLRDAVDNGIGLSFDAATGIVVADGSPGRRVLTKNISWIDAVDLDEFNVSDQAWEDRTAVLAANEPERDNLILIDHAPGWLPEQGKVSTNTLLYNIETGERSRLPFRGGLVMPAGACFSSDRTKAYIAGEIWNEGGTAIFEIDLLTGRERRLTSPAIVGHIMGPTLSPDGNTLAAANLSAQSGADRILESQILRIDVATGEATAWGKQLDTAFLSWLPDGRGLILVKRTADASGKRTESAIARMDLDGAVTPLLSGAFPYVLASGDRLMFRDEAADQWKTCDLDGGDVRLIGDGLQDFGFPAVSPRSARAVMMKYGGAKGPRPYVVDIVTGKETAIAVEDGLWITPSWR